MAASDPQKIISVTRFVPAPAQVIFDLLADPAMHAVIDGSGTVKNARSDAPKRLSLGAQFGMDMRIGLPYKITNEVVEFEEARRIAWRHFGGHVWRYMLEPAEGGTQVTEQFDWNTSKAAALLELTGAMGRNKNSIRATLERMAKHFGET